MNAKLQLSQLVRVSSGIAFAVVLMAAPLTYAQPVLWTGPSMTFSQTVANATSRDVIIPSVVELTRNNRQWLYNPAAGDGQGVAGTPTNTRWAFAMRSGTNIVITSLADVTNLTYNTFSSYRNGSLDGVLLGNKQMVMHILNPDIYIPVKFTAWPGHNPPAGTGRFAYVRATAPPVAPTVTITNPVSGAVFAAPATVQIQASASVSSGNVTNVAFLSSGGSLGSDQSSPFSFTTGSLSAGAYALSAVATAAGISTTSSVVNITVVSPVDVTITTPQITNGVFSFNYTANSGLRYVVQNSSNLIDWVSLATNTAGASPVHYTSPLPPNDARYYRVGRLPNP